MHSRLDAVGDWEERARGARYQVSRLATALGISRQQLARYYLDHCHLSPKRWLEELRWRVALALLDRGLCVKEVAANLHFEHDTHFSRAFKQCFGQSPTDYLASRASLSAQMFQNGRECSKMVVDSAGLAPGGGG